VKVELGLSEIWFNRIVDAATISKQIW